MIKKAAIPERRTVAIPEIKMTEAILEKRATVIILVIRRAIERDLLEVDHQRKMTIKNVGGHRGGDRTVLERDRVVPVSARTAHARDHPVLENIP